MTTVLVTGPIGGGKSTACRYFESLGWPVYDSDSRCKALYDSVPGLKGRIESELGIPFAELGLIFSRPALRERLEGIVYPLVAEDIASWKAAVGGPLAFVESATAAAHPEFANLYDKVLIVTAPAQLRHARNPKAAERDASQRFPRIPGSRTIRNEGSPEQLYAKLDNYLKTIL